MTDEERRMKQKRFERLQRQYASLSWCEMAEAGQLSCELDRDRVKREAETQPDGGTEAPQTPTRL